MDERQLRILRELGELGSVHAVAGALYVTPSAISQQLRLLQQTFDVPLTRRAGRRLVLTDAGRALAVAAVDVETALARARHAVDDFTGDERGTVRVAAFHSAGQSLFPLLLADPAAPPWELADEDVAQSDFPALTREYDLVVAHRLDHTADWPPGLAVVPLLHESLDVALPAGHPLADKPRLTARDVAGERWIAVHDGFPLLASIEAVAAAAGRPVEIVHRINDVTMATAVVAAGGGIALVPRWTGARHPGVVLRPLRGPHPQRHIDVLHRPERAARRSVVSALAALRRAAGVVRRAGR